MRFTQTPTPSITATPSLTPSITPTQTPTGTVCPGLTPTATNTPTNTTTSTGTLPATPTQTQTQTGTPNETPTMTPTPSVTPVSGSCACYSITYETIPSGLQVRYRDCVSGDIITNDISMLLQRDNLDGTYTSFICVNQNSTYAIPVCVSGGVEVTCDPLTWVEGGSCSGPVDCDVNEVLNVFGYMEPCIGGTVDDYMGAAVFLQSNVAVDTNFHVEVRYVFPGQLCSGFYYTQSIFLDVLAGNNQSNFNACSGGPYFPGGAVICSACIVDCDNPSVSLVGVECT